MKTVNSAAQVEQHVHAEPERASTHVLDLESIKTARRGRKVDNWFLAALVVVVSLFAGTFVVYMLMPTMRTLASSVLH